jgi:predicted nucleotidyltransferase
MGDTMNELRETRIRKSLTQNEAAELLGISRRTYQKYESTDVFDEKYQYLLYRMKSKTVIDENHGILSIDYIKTIVNDILKNYNIKSCYLFCSYAKGKAKETSDIDLMIDSDITGLDFYGLIEELRERLNKKIDLLTLNSLSNNSAMLVEITKDGIKIYG